MSQNKINFGQETKLDRLDQKVDKISIIRSVELAKTKSFRFRPIDKERLNKILKALNEHSSTKRFNEIDVIRALLVAGENLSGDKIISYLRKSIL